MDNRAANRQWHVLVNVLAASASLPEPVRLRLYSRGGIDLGGTSIRPACWFFSYRIDVGPGGMINHGCYFENREPIAIGSRVFLGPQVFVGTSTQEMGGRSQRLEPTFAAPPTSATGLGSGRGP